MNVPIAIIAAVALVLLLIYVFQRRLIYLPYGDVPPATAVLPGAEEVRFVTDDGLELSGWFVPAKGAEPAPATLVANGNAGNRQHRAPLAQALVAAGVSVLLFDYRGYGGNPGKPTEAGLYRDARAAREYLSRREDVDPERLVYFGESLGAAVVVKLATEHPPAGLALRSPFTSLAAVGRLHYPWLPVGWMLKDRYESLAEIKDVHVPVLVIAGGRDAIIPATQSRALYDAAAGPKRFVLIEGADHNDAELFVGPEVLAAVGRFLDEVT
jgi:fermentation-respiration switch protein FrsA (DUF1100 family)